MLMPLEATMLLIAGTAAAGALACLLVDVWRCFTE
jgi:hypothetical protein